jgi:hypothetical protein
MKIMESLNFGELSRFFLKGLNPFKFQIKFKFELFLEFLIPIHEDFEDDPKRKVVPYHLLDDLKMFNEYLRSGRSPF